MPQPFFAASVVAAGALSSPYLWTQTGNVLSPTTLGNVISVPAAGTGSEIPLTYGYASGVQKRLFSWGNADAYLSVNFQPGTLQDDTTKPGWYMGVDCAADGFFVGRCAPGGTPNVNLLSLDHAADLTLGGNFIQWGSYPVKARLYAYAEGCQLQTNSEIGGAQDDPTKDSWQFNLDCTGGIGSWGVFRQPPGNTTTTFMMAGGDYLGNFTIAGNDVQWGSTLVKARLYAYGNGCQLQTNSAIGGTLDDPTKDGWQLNLDCTGGHGSWGLFRSPPGTTGITNLMAGGDYLGNFTIVGPTATKSTGTTWANPSDRRLKRDIIDYLPGLNAICRLLPRRFHWKATNREGYGYVADEVAPIFPEAVSVGPDGMATLDTSNLALALVNAVKELAGRMTALEAR